jgi:hypothetical protein
VNNCPDCGNDRQRQSHEMGRRVYTCPECGCRWSYALDGLKQYEPDRSFNDNKN